MLKRKYNNNQVVESPFGESRKKQKEETETKKQTPDTKQGMKTKKKPTKAEKVIRRRQLAIKDLEAGHWERHSHRHVLNSWTIDDPRMIPKTKHAYECDKRCVRCQSEAHNNLFTCAQ
jgi:hypothetical protein